MTLPFNDLARLNSRYKDELTFAIREVLDSGTLILGSMVEDFERAFAELCGTAACVGVANATDGLELTLRAAGCGVGSEVVVAGNAGGYSTAAAVAVGALPIIADINPETHLISPDEIAAVLSEKTRAVIVTHLYGGVVDVNLVRAILPRDIILIEDCSQAHGARINGSFVGSLGDLAVFSFYPTKNLGAVGDAGAITGRRTDLLQIIRELRQYGWRTRYHISRPFGRNSRLDPVQAAVLRVKLPDLLSVNAERIEIANFLARESGLDGAFIHRSFGDEVVHAGHLCVITHSDRDEFARRLRQRGVPSSVHFPVPDHHQKPLRDLVGIRTPLPHTELACDHVLSLPNFPGMTDTEMQNVANAIRTEW